MLSTTDLTTTAGPFSIGDGPLTDVAISPDGSTVAVGRAGDEVRTVAIVNVETGAQLELTGHGAEVSSVAFSPDGTILASGSDDRTIILWSTNDWQRQGVLTGHTDRVHRLTFDPPVTCCSRRATTARCAGGTCRSGRRSGCRSDGTATVCATFERARRWPPACTAPPSSCGRSIPSVGLLIRVGSRPESSPRRTGELRRHEVAPGRLHGLVRLIGRAGSAADHTVAPASIVAAISATPGR